MKKTFGKDIFILILFALCLSSCGVYPNDILDLTDGTSPIKTPSETGSTGSTDNTGDTENTTTKTEYSLSFDSSMSQGRLNSGYYVFYLQYKLKDGSSCSKLYLSGNQIDSVEIDAGAKSYKSVQAKVPYSSYNRASLQFYLTDEKGNRVSDILEF